MQKSCLTGRLKCPFPAHLGFCVARLPCHMSRCVPANTSHCVARCLPRHQQSSAPTDTSLRHLPRPPTHLHVVLPLPCLPMRNVEVLFSCVETRQVENADFLHYLAKKLGPKNGLRSQSCCTTRSSTHAKPRTYAASPAFDNAADVSVGAVCCVGTSQWNCECGEVLADFGCECAFLR